MEPGKCTDKKDRKRTSWLRSPILWFLLVSILVHHALIVSVVRVPALERYERYDVKLVKEKPEEERVAEKEPLEPPVLEDPLALPESVLEERKIQKRKPDPQEPEPEKAEPEPEPDKDEDEPEPIEPLDTEKLDGLHFVDIDSHETDEPPPDAEYFAPIDSQVDEETVAENTNMDEDQGKSQPDSSGDPADTQGNAPEHLAAHLVEDDPQPTEDSPQKTEPEKIVYADTSPQPSVAPQEQFQGDVSEKSHESDPQPPPVPFTVDDAPPLKLAVSDDGELYDPQTGKKVPSLAEAKKAKENKGGKKKGDAPRMADLDLSYAQMEGVLGAEMEKLQETWKESKKSKQKGGFTDDVGKVFSQLENFTPDVKPGNQTALNAAYHPYAEYITAFHRSLHPQWGDGYIASLVSKPNGDPLNDMSLWVKLEFVILPDGSIEKVTVVKTSGNLVFDVAAIDSIYAGEPYPPPPEIIKSYDGKVYMRWGFYRNHSQCGVWNAEPYILTGPGTKKKKVKPPKEKSPPEPG